MRILSLVNTQVSKEVQKGIEVEPDLPFKATDITDIFKFVKLARETAQAGMGEFKGWNQEIELPI